MMINTTTVKNSNANDNNEHDTDNINVIKINDNDNNKDDINDTNIMKIMVEMATTTTTMRIILAATIMIKYPGVYIYIYNKWILFIVFKHNTWEMTTPSLPTVLFCKISNLPASAPIASSKSHILVLNMVI